jgi:hypothetical protein
MAVVRPFGGIRVQFLEFLHQFFIGTFTVYLLHELKVAGYFRKTLATNKRQFSNPWRAECSEVDDSGYQKRSGYCRALNAASAPTPRVFTLNDSREVHFRGRWQRVALELIPNGSRPKN